MDFMRKDGRRLVMRTGSNFTLRDIDEELPHMELERSLTGAPE